MQDFFPPFALDQWETLALVYLSALPAVISL
jgi:hypothetical protein